MDYILRSFPTSKVFALLTISTVAYAGQLVTVDNPPTNPVNTSSSGGGGGSVNLSTYAYGTSLGSTGTAVGGVTAAGNFQTFAVDTSSRVQSNSYSQNITTITHNGIAQQVTSTYTVATDTWNINVNVQQVNGTGVSVNGDGGINSHILNTPNVSIQSNAPISLNQIVSATPKTTSNVSGELVVSCEVSGSSNAVTQAGTYTTTPGTGTTSVQGTLGNGALVPANNRVATLPGIAANNYGNNAVGYSNQRNAAPIIMAQTGLMGVWSGPDHTFAGYNASTTPFTVLNTTADLTGICGFGSGQLSFIYYLKVDCTQTSASIIPITVVKRSTSYTGVFSSMTSTPQDSAYTTFSGSHGLFFPNQNLANGAQIGNVDTQQIFCTNTSTPTANQPYVSPDNWRMKPIVLRTPSECLGVNLQGQSIPGAKFTVTWGWFEANSP